MHGPGNSPKTGISSFYIKDRLYRFWCTLRALLQRYHRFSEIFPQNFYGWADFKVWGVLAVWRASQGLSPKTALETLKPPPKPLPGPCQFGGGNLSFRWYPEGKTALLEGLARYPKTALPDGPNLRFGTLPDAGFDPPGDPPGELLDHGLGLPTGSPWSSARKCSKPDEKDQETCIL